MYAGEPARAIEVVESNLRLDPFPWGQPFGYMGVANYMLERYEEAVHLCRECALRVPNLQMPHLWLASACAQSGQLQEARDEAAEVLRINPAFTIESWKRLAVFKNLKDADHLIDGIRKTGLPES